MLYRFCIALAILITIKLPVFSESLTLDEAVNIALQNNAQLKADRARLGMSDAEIITAGVRPNPNLVSDNGIAEDTYRLGVEQTFELGGKRHQRIALAKAQKNLVQAEIDQVALEIRTDVRRAYTQLYLSQERQQAYNDILENAGNLLTVTQKREQAGDVSTLDVLQAEITVIKAKNDIQSLTNQMIEARNQLNNLLNQPLQTTLVLTPPTAYPQLIEATEHEKPGADKTLKSGVLKTDFSLVQLIEAALLNSPELKQNEYILLIAQAKLSLAKINRIPNLSLTAGQDMVIPGGGENQFNAFVIASLELPLWNRQQGLIQKALAEQVQGQQEQAAIKNRIILEVTNAYNAFYAHQNRVMRYETELFPKAQEVVTKSRRSFQEGKSSMQVPLSAQQAYTEIRLGYLQALVDLQNAISDLGKAVGTTL